MIKKDEKRIIVHKNEMHNLEKYGFKYNDSIGVYSWNTGDCDIITNFNKINVNCWNGEVFVYCNRSLRAETLELILELQFEGILEIKEGTI